MVAIQINMLLSLSVANANPIGWSADINLTPDDDKDSKEPSIGIFKDNIHVVWGDSRHYPVTNRAEIYYKNSTDGGKTWNSEVRLTFSDSTKLFPRIVVNGNNIHLIWIDDRDGGGQKIYYKNSSDGGNTWSADRRISPLSTDTNGMNGDIAVNGNNIHIIYPSTYKLFYINSTDSGITWSEPQQLTGSNRDSNHPAIAVNGSNVHIVWMDHYDRFGNPTMGAIFYMNSTDGGLTWSEDYNLTPMNLDASYSDIVTNGNTIHVVFSEQASGIWETHYRRSEDSGLSWSEDIQLTNWGRDHHGSSIDICDDNVSVVWWTNWIKEPDGNGEIYYINSTDNGYSWGESLRLTYDPERAGQADLSMSECMVYIVWNDVRDGNAEIYYKYCPFYPPPTNITVDIWGTNLTLNWTTPQTGLNPVDYYLIYRVTDPDAFTFSDSEIVYNSSGTGNDLLTTWNDTTALLDESTNYYYIVRAVYENGEIDTNENIVGKFVTKLDQGWNLFSTPLVQNDTSISEVLKSIDGNYNIIQSYDSKNGIWRSSSMSLTNINRTMGLWIHMKNVCNLSVVGVLPESTDIALYEGWNLVGYPSLKTRNLNDALSGINWQAVQHYYAFDGNDPWKHNSTKKPDRLNDLKEMQPGRGYWVYVTINDTWVRTRVGEDNKVVIWRVGEPKEIIVTDQPIFESMIKNPIQMDEEDNYQIDIIPDNPTKKDDGNNLAISLIPLVILIAFVLTEIGLLHRKRR
jgi:hypothetical protein